MKTSSSNACDSGFLTGGKETSQVIKWILEADTEALRHYIEDPGDYKFTTVQRRKLYMLFQASIRVARSRDRLLEIYGE